MSFDNILIIVGVVIALLVIVGLIKKAIKLGVFIAIIVIALSSTGAGLYIKELTKDYSFEIKDGKVEYNIQGNTGTINVADIESVRVESIRDSDDVKIVVKIQGLSNSIDFTLNKYVYGFAVKGKLEKEFKDKFKDMSSAMIRNELRLTYNDTVFVT